MTANKVKVGGSQEQTAEYILTYVANSIWQRGYQPSLREVCAHMGWRSFNYANFLLRAYFENHGQRGEGHVGARAISFDWKRYVTDETFPRDKRKASAFNPPRRAKAARKKGKQLGRVRVSR